MFPRHWIIFGFLFFSVLCIYAQNKVPFQQEISYQLKVDVDTANKILNGKCLIHYKNNSPDTLKELWIYQRPNACQNENSSFNNRLIEKGNTDLYFSEKRDRGYMAISAIQISSNDHPTEISKSFIIEQNLFNEVGSLHLVWPLLPSQEISIQITYHLKLAKLYEGLATAYIDDVFIFSQWHPEIALYDEGGWHIQSYLGDNEAEQAPAYYSADIHLPRGYALICNGKKGVQNEQDEWHLESNNQTKLIWGMIPSTKIKKEIIRNDKLSIHYYGKTGMNNNWLNAIRDSNDISATTGSNSTYSILQIPSKKYVTPIRFDHFLFTFGNTPKQEAKKIIEAFVNRDMTKKIEYDTKVNKCETYFDNNQRALWSVTNSLDDCFPGKVHLNYSSDVASRKRKTKLTWLYNFNNRNEINYISISPVMIYNAYDQWMPGAFIHNIQFPKNKFQFELLPLFSINEHKWRGAGGFQWIIYENKNKGKLELRNSFRSFGKDKYLNDESQQKITAFTKWQSGIRYYFPNSNSSCLQQFIEWNSLFIQETNPNYKFDASNGATSIAESNDQFSMHQFVYQYQNNRTLYPYSINIKAELGKPFVKFGLEANEYFNYATGGGMNVRFFAGKFFYTQGKNNLTALETQRFHFNLSAPNGYEDYRYDGYFLERNAFEGNSSKQIMIRDGGFKMSTPLLSDKVGRTDNWLGAVNLTTTIPDRMNILNVLPIKIPLLLFADLGTTSENWSEKSDAEQILYEAGLQLSLCKNSFNIYLPLIYSRSFRDYVNTMYPDKKFSPNIRFSVDLDKFGTTSLFR